jgi:hypothetical protein
MYFTSTATHAHGILRLFPSFSLRSLVLQHGEACVSHGLDPSEIAEADDAAAVRWLHKHDGLLPAHLAEDLERIEELTNESGASALLAVGRDAGVDLRSLGVDPVQVAIRAFLDHRPLFERAHGRRTFETLRGSSEFAGRSRSPPPLFDVDALDTLAARFGAEFDARGRSAHCRISFARVADRLIFGIAHGALVKVDESLGDEPAAHGHPKRMLLAEGTIRYRPQRRDIVVFDARAGSLRVRAADAATVRAYRRGFGEFLFRDPEWFGDGRVVSLEPLALGAAAVEVPTPGLREVRVVGLLLRHHAGPQGTTAFRSTDIWPYLRARLNGTLADGELLEAIFHVWPVGEDQPANVRVRVPHRVEYTRISDDLIRPYLEARGFLAEPAARMAI